MGAFDWSSTTKQYSKTIISKTILCEWEMSFHHHHPIQIQGKKQPTVAAKQERTAEKEQQEQGETPLEQDQEEEEKAQCHWDFHLSTVVSSNSSTGASSDTIGVIEFDPSNNFIATAGIARKIRIYSLSSLLHHQQQQQHDQFFQGTQQSTTSFLDHHTSCDFYICTPAKLSSVRWKPDTAGRVVGSGDYDGVVTEYDLEKQVPVFERDEHGGRRVWSIDYSQYWKTVGASGSDDGTTQLWDTRCGTGECVGVIQPSVGRSPVCSVEFDPFGGHLIAVGCADRNAYTYDVRSMSNPVSVLVGHQRTVSYVRFLGQGMLVSAGTDGCLKLWDIEGAPRPIRTYRGHVNNRSFVGLSVWRNGGLLGCGSESNEVFVYDKRWGQPIWVRGLESMFGNGCDQNRFVSSVSWRQVGEDQCTFLAGGSDGVLQVFVGKRRSDYII